MRNILLGTAAVVGFIGFMVTTDLGGLFYTKLTAPLRGQAEAERSIESGASRIQRYQEFFNICQSIQAKEDAIVNLLANDSMDTQKRDIAILANQNARAALIADYNSKSAQAYTSARFKASNLPYQIDRKPFNGSNLTNCTL